MQTIGQRIAERRRNRKMTQQELSRISGVDYNTLIKIEGNKVETPRTETLEKIAAALEIPLDALSTSAPNATYRPQIQGRDILPFAQLPPDRFETLIFTIIDRLHEEWESVQHYAHRGDKGRDTIAKRKGASAYTFFQSKRYQEIGLADFKKELDKLKEHFFDSDDHQNERPIAIVFCVACGVKPTLRDEIKEYAQTIGLPAPEVWAEVELDTKCRALPQVLNEFFGGHGSAAIKGIDEVKDEVLAVGETAKEILKKMEDFPVQVQERASLSNEQEDAELRKASRLVNAENFREAMDLLTPLRLKLEEKKDTRKLHEVYNNIGVCFSNDKRHTDWPQAIDWFERALAVNPDFAKAARNLIICYLNSGGKENWEKALKLAKEKMEKLPDEDGFATFYLLALDRLQRDDEIKSYLDAHPDLREKAKTNIELLTALGNVYLRIHDLDAALELAATGLKEYPDSCNLNLIKGRGLLFRADRDDRIDDVASEVVMRFKNPAEIIEAERHLEKALDAGIAEKQRKPFLDLIRLELLTCTHILGEYDKFNAIKDDIDLSEMSDKVKEQISVREFANAIAQRNFEDAFMTLKGSKLFAQLKYFEVRRLAHIFIAKGAPEFALQLLLPFREEAIQSEDQEYWVMLATCYALLGKKNEAITTAEDVKKRFGHIEAKKERVYSFHSAVANRYVREGESDRMWESINELQKIKPDVPIIRPIKAVEEDGSMSKEIQELFEGARKDYNAKKKLFQENNLPMYILSKAFGKSFPDSIDLPRGNADFDFALPYTFVNEEYFAEGKKIFQDAPKLMLDYASLYNLAKTGCLGLLQMFSKQVIIHELLFEEIQNDLLQEEDKVLRAVWEFVRGSGIQMESRIVEKREIFPADSKDIFDTWLVQTVEIAHQESLLLICDDLNLVKMFRGKVKKVIGSFVVLQAAVTSGYLDKKQFAMALGELAEMFYTFLPFNGKDLLYIAIDDDQKMKTNQIRWGKYDNNEKVQISHRFFHLINQVNLPGSGVRSFLATSVNFIEEMVKLGLLFEDKAKYVYFLSVFFMLWFRENLPSSDKGTLEDAAGFIGMSWGIIIEHASNKEDLEYLKQMAVPAFRKREGDDETMEKVKANGLKVILKGIELRKAQLKID